MPEERLRPDLVGVVRSTEAVPPNTLAVTLEDGRTLRIAPHVRNLLPTGGPFEGTLLLMGQSSEGAWQASLKSDGECFPIRPPAQQLGDEIVFENGLTLRLAPEFHSQATVQGGTYRSHVGRFCVDRRGLVTRYEMGAL